MKCPLCPAQLDPEPQAAVLHLLILHPADLRRIMTELFEGAQFVPPAPPRADEEE